MSEPKASARRTDLVEHGSQKGAAAGKIAAAAYETAQTAYTIYKVAKIGLVATGPAGWAGLAASWVVEWAVSKAIEKGVEYVVKQNSSGGMKEISDGSPNVHVNKLPAARGGADGDPVVCHAGKKVRQGSEWVSFNAKPASRVEDLTTCPGNIATGSKNVFIGGPPVEYNPHATLEAVLNVLTAYNALKKGMVKGAVSGAMGKGVREELTDTVFGKAREKIFDKVWDMGSSAW